MGYPHLVKSAPPNLSDPAHLSFRRAGIGAAVAVARASVYRPMGEIRDAVIILF